MQGFCCLFQQLDDVLSLKPKNHIKQDLKVFFSNYMEQSLYFEKDMQSKRQLSVDIRSGAELGSAAHILADTCPSC